MEYTTLGSTGVTVSRIAIGCMSFGGGRVDWHLDAAESQAIVDRAIDLGINFFDTANTYGNGDSERILGEAIEGYDRDRLVIATKVYRQMDPDNPNSGGLSRKAIDRELDRSLDRLGLDTIDLYQIHRWDYDTPIEETLRALDDAVGRGTVRYLGASSMWTHQFQTALRQSDRLGLHRFVTMQNHYNLVYREEEREMLPFCAKAGVGVIPWSPLARGFLARPYAELQATERGRTDERLHRRPYASEAGRAINDRVAELAADRGASMAQVALAWLLHQEWVDAPIVGVTSPEQVEAAAAATTISLSDADLDYLEEPYEPLPVIGHE